MSKVALLLISTSLKVEEATLTPVEGTVGRDRRWAWKKLHGHQERGRGKSIGSILDVSVPATILHLYFIRHFCILISPSFCWLICLSKL